MSKSVTERISSGLIVVAVAFALWGLILIAPPVWNAVEAYTVMRWNELLTAQRENPMSTGGRILVIAAVVGVVGVAMRILNSPRPPMRQERNQGFDSGALDPDDPRATMG
jgi:hypothetical protein